MLKIKNLTCRNFLSVGNVTQAINFDRKDLTLVLGENIDLGGDGARNGAGKTSIVNALSYALYGQALTNIRKDNLINRTNSKGMLVTIDFEKNGITYRIERGRKPAVMTFFIGDVAQEAKDNDAQGDSRETQAAIERLLGMSHDMFKHVVALNTYTDPFLNLKANDQRAIIEQLLGITLLSEKADTLKEQVKATKEGITKEDIRIKAVTDANERIKNQIESFRRRQSMWLQAHESSLLSLVNEFDRLSTLNIDDEIKSHHLLEDFSKKEKEFRAAEAELQKSKATLKKVELRLTQLANEIESLNNHKCYACGQDVHDAQHGDLLEKKVNLLTEAHLEVSELTSQIEILKNFIDEFTNIGEKPSTFYKTVQEAYNHQTTIGHLVKQIETKSIEADPYADQIKEMETEGIEEVSYNAINELTYLKDHQEFLLKLLTNKDSFVRKKIIDQNLNYLNSRLDMYLQKVGLPHTVKFQNDLTVSIEELGRELDFYNLSRGEMTRVIIAMSLSFRDVWETLFHPINLLFVDELLDNGLDSTGVELSVAVLKKMGRDMNKSVWLVSHKDELVSRVPNILKVTKENGFTTFEISDE